MYRFLQSSVISGCLVLAFAAAGYAVRPADPFADHMVLQRDKPAPVWGWAEPGERVQVSFAGQVKNTVADGQGKWQVVLDPLKLSTVPQTMTLRGKQTVALNDVLVGDVWICSGQSNMGRNVDSSILPEGMTWKYPLIRYVGMGGNEPYPIERRDTDETNPWRVLDDEETIRSCCAVGFFFARRIQQEIEVPIGLLWAAFPGSTIDEWMPPHAWRMEPKLKEIADRVESCYPDTAHGRQVLKEHLAQMDAWIEEVDRSLAQGTPFPYPQPLLPEPKKRDACGFYNGGIHRGVPLAIKGVLWYQGESDQRNSLWDIELKAMAASWRDAFDVKGSGEDIAFYWVQLQRSGDYCSPIVRQKQFNGLKLIPNSGMAVLLDLDVNVHPVNKVDTGIRLARWALHREYGKRDLVPSGPLYASHRIDGSKIIVEFDYADGGLRLGRKELLDPVKFETGREVPNVELAGEDKRWSPAKAVIEGPRLIVTSAKVPAPRHVRYCYKNIPEPPFLYNAEGLPAATFTTSEK